MVKRSLLIGAAALAFIATRAQADDFCSYKGTPYSHGSAACQAGTQYRCDDGEWKALGVACSEKLAEGAGCKFGGEAYSSGSVSCQSGTRYRCDDAVWKSLGVTCGAGDAPRIIPGARTCMYNNATVATNSTICKSGTTFLCDDGEWRNLGTACQ